MHGFLSNLTAALLALHTVLGCCSHHAHASAGDCHSAPAIESHDCHHAEDSPATTHDDHKTHFCKQNTCVFLTSTKWSDLLRPADAAFSAVVLTDFDFLVNYTSVSAASFFEPDALLPPLRIHLLDRVLLL